MERLTEAERILKYGVIPEEEEGLLTFQKQYKVSITRYFSAPGRKHFFPILSARVKVRGSDVEQLLIS